MKYEFKEGDVVVCINARGTSGPGAPVAGAAYVVRSVSSCGDLTLGGCGDYPWWGPRFTLLNEPKPVDMVSHPPHYAYGPHEVIDVIEEWQLGYHLGNTVKYIARAKRKGRELEDLRKGRWYLDRAIARLEKEAAK